LKSYHLFITILAGFILVIQGCKDNPTSVGLGILPPGDKPGLKVDTLAAESFSTVFTPISTFGSDRLLVGKYLGYDAITTVRFTGLPAGILDTVTITNAYIVLRAVYHFGDASAPFGFQGFQLTANSDSANYDSLTILRGNYYSLNPVLAFPSTNLGDTSALQCSIDTGVVHNWFAASPTSPNYGVILVATTGSIIKGFGSFSNLTTSYSPILIVHYTKNGVSDSVSYNTGESRFIAEIPQSTLVSSDAQSMFVQSGVSYRAQLTFNLHSLPQAGLILKANLELTYNAASSNLNSFAADTLYSYYLNNDSTITQAPFEGQTITSGSNKVYRFAIADYVRSWANGDSLQRLQFGGLRETSSLDLYALFGPPSPTAVRPRLIITSLAQ
jgi:hypothetical protein